MKKAGRANLTEGAVGRTLIKLTIPMFLAILAMVVFNLVDTAFVGRLGTEELAAISFTFPVVLVINSLAGGLGVGASAVISQAIGKGDRYRVQRLTTDSLGLSVMVVVVFVSIGLVTIDPLFRLLGATPEVLPLIRQYMTLWYIGVIFVVIPMVGNAAIRATGDTRTPATIMMVAAGINIILDPILIFGLGFFPGLGIAGAALATVIARAITLGASLWVLVRRERMVIWSRPKLKEVWASWKQVLYIGLPAAGTNVLVPISAAIITGMVAAYGPEAVAALGVGTRVESLALGVIMALASVLTPFVGQNWGAGCLDRVRLSASYVQRFALLWGVLLFILLIAFGRSVALIFSDDAVVVATLIDYLRIVPLSYGLLGLLMLATATLNALNRPLQAALLTLLRLFLLYVPLALLGSALFGLRGIFGAAAVANCLAGIAAFLWLRSILRGRSLRRPMSADMEVTGELSVASHSRDAVYGG